MRKKLLKDYIQSINNAYGKGDTTEYSYRTVFEYFLKQLLGNKIQITQEAKAHKGYDGKINKPDFTIRYKGALVGYIETKSMGQSMEHNVQKATDQLQRDFGSDLSVNILWHTFEQFITDFEYLTGDTE